MKTGRFPALLLAALALAMGAAQAKTTFTPTRTLAFGRFVAATGGTVTVSPAGVRSRGGGVILVASTATSAAYTWTDSNKGNANRAMSISLPADGAVKLTSGSSNMSLLQFTSTPSGTGVLSGGTLNMTVGATLQVSANQKPGSYTGNIPLTINYQ